MFIKKLSIRKILRWAPRVLAILLILFFGLLSFDAFNGSASFGEKLLGFFIHLTPFYISVAALFMAWRWPFGGGVIFVLLGFLYLIIFGGRAINETAIFIAGFLFLIGLMFLFGSIKLKNNSVKT